MPTITTIDPIATAFELREQIATHERHVGFFVGAGASMAAGLPGLDELTLTVAGELKGEDKDLFEITQKSLGKSANIEDFLDHLRLLRDLLRKDASKTYEGISGAQAKKLDIAICQAIQKAVLSPDPTKMGGHYALASWILHVRRDQPIEIFTTNYDLVIEMAFERCEVPHFDGFVGTVRPFFVPECVEADGTKQTEDFYPPRAWARLWKLHGSISWQLEKDSSGNERIVRVALLPLEPETELVIYPSREKYTASRKLPFVSYMDRLREVVSTGEYLLFIVGYSFRDQHLNEILRQGLRSNTRLAVNAFTHSDPGPDLLALAEAHRNLSVFGPTSVCMRGMQGTWTAPSRKKQPGEEWPFWDETKNRFRLGDFASFGRFLELITTGFVTSTTGFVSGPTKPTGTP
jgi:hypothetical protein